MHYKELVAAKFAELVYYGKWFTPLREALSAFVDKTQEHVTGDVKLKLYKGNMINAGVTSPYSLYSENMPPSTPTMFTIRRTPTDLSTSSVCPSRLRPCFRRRTTDFDIQKALGGNLPRASFGKKLRVPKKVPALRRIFVKLWENGLHAALNENADDFNSSISFDGAMYKQDIEARSPMRQCFASRALFRPRT